ncbi:hypothetical protein KCP74_12350 [Salmonella enterica subsp. enterica]|nr:hypothetical protein KCP74_12350 [Salmonella enterica subsp. enterica]
MLATRHIKLLVIHQLKGNIVENRSDDLKSRRSAWVRRAARRHGKPLATATGRVSNQPR